MTNIDIHAHFSGYKAAKDSERKELMIGIQREISEATEPGKMESHEALEFLKELSGWVAECIDGIESVIAERMHDEEHRD